MDSLANELSSAKKKRTQAKIYLTKAEKDLISCVTSIEENREISCSRIDNTLEVFQTKLKLYDDRQSEYEILLEEEEMVNEIDSEAEYRDAKISIFLEMRDKLLLYRKSTNEQSGVLHNDATTTNNNKSSTAIPATLPKLELPHFHGDVCEWQSFWDKFSAIIDTRTDLSEVNKFSYLQSLLKSEARSCLQGLALTESNYVTAKQLLQKRFGRKEKVVVSHIQKLLYISSKHSNDLWKLYDEVQIHVRSLENLDISGNNYGLVLTPLILHQLPNDIRMEWARQSEGKEGDLEYLLSFLFGEIQRRERSQTFEKVQPPVDGACVGNSAIRRERRNKLPGTASAFLNHGSGMKKRSCAFCGADHFSDKCPDILNLNHEQRKAKVKTMNLCFKCLSKTHRANSCNKVCYHCKGNHHSVLHINKMCVADKSGEDYSTTNMIPAGNYEQNTVLPRFENAQGVESRTYYTKNQSTGQNTLMQCVQVPINGHDLFILFDSGSDRSYINLDTAKKLRLLPKGKESLSFHTFAASRGEKECALFEFCMGDLKLNLLGIDKICNPMLRAKVPQKVLNDLHEIPVYERLDKDNLIKVDILVGLDYYWSLVDRNVVHIRDGLVAQKTRLGWMVSGSYFDSRPRIDTSATSLFCVHEPTDATVRQCWELDSIGINGNGSLESDLVGSKVFDQFCKEVSMSDNRYQVGLPWKSEDHKDMLVNNIDSAQKRLVSLDKRLSLNPELKDRYHDVFVDLEKQNMIEEVPIDNVHENNAPVFYLPHRPVVREESKSTKVRPVFDASAKGVNGVSLNDCMEIGPKLIPDLTGILLRFRRWRFGLTADIQKAFLQIELKESDRDVHRFLLFTPEGNLKHMRFRRVTFGNACSPFLLNATLKLHLSKQEEDRTIKELKDNLYVDDWLTGSDSETNLTNMMDEADAVMKQGSFVLTKWASNSMTVMDSDCKPLHNDFDQVSQKVLGVGWDPQTDSFHFKFLSSACGVLLSKRTLLGIISRIFDPIGFLTPFTVTLKIMFQEAWKDGYEWDTILPEDMQQEIECWVSGLQTISQWKIPRRLSCCDWSSLDRVDLLVFSDASEKAYGSCIYLRSTFGGNVDTSLVISKVRVAPLKKVTLPLLELLAALLAARLLHFVRDALQLPEDTSYVCYTDSMITLGWIRGEPFKWKQFVRNRVTEIQSLTDSNRWEHCPGNNNPADLLTRGVSASVLTTSHWLTGPEWLLGAFVCPKSESEIEVGFDPPGSVAESEIDKELESCNGPTCAMVSKQTPFIDFEKFSSFGKLVRVVSNVLKFVKKLRKCKNVSCDTDLLNEAKIVVFRSLQMKHYREEFEELNKSGVVKKGSSLANLSPFISEDGLLRVRGRLGHAHELSYDEKHPIILPKCHVSLLLVWSQHIALKHAGVNLLITSLRNKYWIISVRPLAKRVVRLCMDCQRHDSRLLEQRMAPLPETRITQAPPFAVVGIDYAGPLFCSDIPGLKLYILLFTCAVTRAVHLELLDSMTADDFLLAFKRFAARRAMPTVVYSDNAQTFKRAQHLLSEHLGQNMFKWQNQPALSPWWGGFYERMVRSVKSSLRKTIGRKSIPRKELETVLIEIEACINSRPLTNTSDNDTYLTPSHFLVGRGCPLSSPELTNLNQVIDLSTLHDHHRMLLDQFWEIWRNEYLRALPPLRVQPINTRLNVGSVVLIKDDNKKRMFWDLGRVIKTFNGLDGCVRAVQIKTAKNCIVRSVQRLLLLELDHDDSMDTGSETGKPVENQKVPGPFDSTMSKDSVSDQISFPKDIQNQNQVSHRVSRSGRVIKSPNTFY